MILSFSFPEVGSDNLVRSVFILENFGLLVGEGFVHNLLFI